MSLLSISYQKQFQLQKQMHYLPTNIATESDKMFTEPHDPSTPSDRHRNWNE